MLGKMEAFQMVILKRKLSTAMQNQAHDYWNEFERLKEFCSVF